MGCPRYTGSDVILNIAIALSGFTGLISILALLDDTTSAGLLRTVVEVFAHLNDHLLIMPSASL